MKFTLSGYIPQNVLSNVLRVYEHVAEVSFITSDCGIREFQNGVMSSAFRLSLTSFVPTASTKSREKGRASARIDSRFMMTTFRIGEVRCARGGCERSAAGADICLVTRSMKSWFQCGGGIFPLTR